MRVAMAIGSTRRGRTSARRPGRSSSRRRVRCRRCACAPASGGGAGTSAVAPEDRKGEGHVLSSRAVPTAADHGGDDDDLHRPRPGGAAARDPPSRSRRTAHGAAAGRSSDSWTCRGASSPSTPCAYWPSLPRPGVQCLVTAVVPTHRCGAVPDSPFLLPRNRWISAPDQLLHTISAACDRPAAPCGARVSRRWNTRTACRE